MSLERTAKMLILSCIAKEPSTSKDQPWLLKAFLEEMLQGLW